MKKRLVGGDAFNARQRAVVVAIGLGRYLTLSLPLEMPCAR